MPQSNVQLVQGIYEAFASGDIPSVLLLLDPGIEWREAESFIYADGNPYIGPDAVLGLFVRIGSDWDGFAAVPDQVLDAGDAVVATGHYTGEHRVTGKAVRAQFAHVFTLRDGRVVKFQQYTDTAQFAKAVRP